ncbi:uncharacterized protein O3C94_019631 [Discoglossus pictus]
MSSLTVHYREPIFEASLEEIPTLLHCAAKFGLKEVTVLLMECPGADRISRITNKYGDDPAKIAEKYGHKHIQEIIHQMANNAIKNDYDIYEGQEEHEPEDIYIDMETNAADKCTHVSYQKALETKEDPSHGHDDHTQKLLAPNSYNEKNESKFDCSDLNEDLEIDDDYCFSAPGDRPVAPTNHDLQDEEFHTIPDNVEVYWDDPDKNSIEEEETEIKNGQHLHSYDIEGDDVYEDLQVHTSIEDVTIDHSYLMTSTQQYDDTSYTPVHIMNDAGILDIAPEEEETNHENTLWEGLGRHIEEQNEMEEEPLLAASTLTSSQNYEECYIPKEEREESSNGNIWWEEHDKQTETVNKDKEEPLIIASTDDDLYLVFETASKKNTREKSLIAQRDLALETSLVQTQEDGEFYNAQEEREGSSNDNIWWEEENEHIEAENKYEEEPLVIASTDDDLYLVFETASKKTKRGETSSTVHRPLAPETSSVPSYNSRAERREKRHNEYVLSNEQIKYIEEDNEEDPYTYVFGDDNLDPLLNIETGESQTGQKSFTVHRPSGHRPGLLLSETGSPYISQESKEESSSEDIFYDAQDEQTEEEKEYDDEDPYSFMSTDDHLYMALPLETHEKSQRGRKSFIIHRPPAPAPRPRPQVSDSGASYISLVFRQKEENKLYGTVQLQDRIPSASSENPTKLHQCVPTEQDELILLQENVKLGIITMDEALLKFQQWQNEKSGLDILQQKKLQQLRDNIIGDKPDDEKLYDKITIVHQPSALTGKKKNKHVFDNNIYQIPHKPQSSPRFYTPVKKENEIPGKPPKGK